VGDADCRFRIRLTASMNVGCEMVQALNWE